MPSGSKTTPLQGTRVIDLSRVLAGPMAAQMLGDLGADVVKIEQPGSGDLVRSMGAARLAEADGSPSKETSLFLAANRNKRSITVDLSKAGGQDVVRRLCAQSDVLIENYIPGTLKKFGLDYEQIRKVNPRLVYCSVSGFGQTGPRSREPGFDGLFQAMGGLMSVNGHPDDAPGGGPLKVGPNIVDGVTALYATVGILAALKQRDATGLGQHLDIGLFDCTLHWLSPTIETFLVAGTVPQRTGNHPLSGGPSTVLECRDGRVYFITGDPSRFERLCAMLGVPELPKDPRFIGPARWQNREALASLLQERVGDRSAQELIDALKAIGCPAGRVNNVAEAIADPQAVHRGALVDVPHPLREDLKLVANPIRMSAADMAYARPPRLGEHTDEILRERLGLDAAAIARLRSDGAI